MIVELLAQLSSTYLARKNDDILLVQNSPGARLPACAIFFGCEIRQRFFARRFEVSL
jgi:hypothetical protein